MSAPRKLLKFLRDTSSALRGGVKMMNQWLKDVRNLAGIKLWWKVLELKLIGHYRYYGMSGNMPEMRAFYKQTLRLAF